MTWYDRHQRLAVCYNGLLFVPLGFLAYNWFNFGCVIQVKSRILSAEVSFTLVIRKRADCEQQELCKADILHHGKCYTRKGSVSFMTGGFTPLPILN